MLYNVVFILGKVGSGKDTLAKILKTDYDFEIFHYGDRLKSVLEFAGWDGKKDLKGRKLLQNIGLAFRNYDINHWVDWMFEDIVDYIEYQIVDQRRKVINLCIADVRHPNEISRFKELMEKEAGENSKLTVKYVTIRVTGPNRDDNREMDQDTLKDISETAMDNYRVDYLVMNVAEIANLKMLIDDIVKEEFGDQIRVD